MDRSLNIFGKNLKQCRTILQIGQSEISDRTGIAQSALSRYEKGDSVPSVDIAARIASALGVPVDLLMTHHEIEATDLSLILLLQELKRILYNERLTHGKLETLKVIIKVIREGI